MSKLLEQINKAPRTIKKLGEVFEIIDGDRGTNYPSKSEFTKNGYCVFLNTKNVPSQGFDFSNIDFISKERDGLLRKGKLQRDDIVMTTRGTIGNVAYYTHGISFDCIRINSGMVILRSKPETDRLYLYTLIKSPIFNAQLKNTSSGSAQPQLPIKDLKEIELYLPDLPTQKKIAEILSVYDAKIENNNLIIKKLEAVAKTLFNEWFINFRFPGYEKAKFVDSEMGEIPEGWTIGNIETICNRLPSGKVFKENELSLSGNVPVYDQSSKGIIGFHNEEPAFSAGVDNPILIFGDHTCRTQLVCESFSLGPNTIPLSEKNNYSPIFSYLLIKELIEQREYKRHWNELVSYKLIIPTPDLVNLFSQKAKVFIEKIITSEKENISLRSQRNQLLAKLI